MCTHYTLCTVYTCWHFLAFKVPSIRHGKCRFAIHAVFTYTYSWILELPFDWSDLVQEKGGGEKGGGEKKNYEICLPSFLPLSPQNQNPCAPRSKNPECATALNNSFFAEMQREKICTVECRVFYSDLKFSFKLKYNCSCWYYIL